MVGDSELIVPHAPTTVSTFPYYKEVFPLMMRIIIIIIIIIIYNNNNNNNDDDDDDVNNI